MSDIFHLVAREAWDQVPGDYAPRSLETEGFVHCSTQQQLERVAIERFAGDDDLLVLRIDPSRLTAELRWEDSHADGELFPHIHGPVDRQAILSVEPHRGF